MLGLHCVWALRDAGRRMPLNDSWIAATALAHAIPVVSQDEDYDDVPGLATSFGSDRPEGAGTQAPGASGTSGPPTRPGRGIPSGHPVPAPAPSPTRS